MSFQRPTERNCSGRRINLPAPYGGVLLAAAVAYWLLQQTIIAAQGPASQLKAAIGGDWKGKLSPLGYALGIVSTLWWPRVALALYVAVALLWLVPTAGSKSPWADGSIIRYAGTGRRRES